MQNQSFTHLRAYCIGNQTADEAKKSGFVNCIIAKEATIDSLVPVSYTHLVPSKIQELEQFILQTYQLDSCIILSTCNRTELWISAPEAMLSSLSPTTVLCDALQVPVEQSQSFFIERSGKDAVSYLQMCIRDRICKEQR